MEQFSDAHESACPFSDIGETVNTEVCKTSS